jgi:hypothetical protein
MKAALVLVGAYALLGVGFDPPGNELKIKLGNQR